MRPNGGVEARARLLALAGSLAVLVGGAWLPATVAAGPGQAVVTTYPNGMRLIVLEQPEEAVAKVDVYVAQVGAVRKPGLAHLAEHLMFCSAEGAPNGSLVDSLALNGGDFGAATSLEMVHLWSTCLPSAVPRALALEATRLGHLRPTAEDLEYQRRRVLGEHDLHRELDANAGIIRRVTALAYGADASAADPLLGRREDIAAISMADVESYLAGALGPDRTVVLVSGPVSPAAVAEAAASTLGALPTVPATGGRPLPPPSTPGPCWVAQAERVGDALAVGFRLPCSNMSERALVLLAESIMERERGHPVLQFYGNEALLTLYVEYEHSDSGSDAANAERALGNFWNETHRVILNVRDSWSFERNRARNVRDLRTRAASPRQRAEWQAQQLAAGAELPDIEAVAAVIDTLSQSRAAAFFADHFVPERAFAALAVGHTRPREWSWAEYTRLRVNPYLEFRRSGDQVDAERIAPVLAAARALPLGKSAAISLPSGVPVRVLTIPGSERFCIGGVRCLPDLFEGPESRHAARMLFYESIVNLAYSESDAAVAPQGDYPQYGTRLSNLPHSMVITAEGDTDKAGAVAAAMNKRLQRDGLNNYVFVTLAGKSETWAAALKDMSAVRALNWRLGRLAGSDHALARWLKPDPDCVAKWGRPWAEALHRRICTTDGLTLVAVGNLTADEVGRCFAPTLGSFRRSQPGAASALPSPPTGPGGRVFHDELGDVANISVMFAGGGTAAAAELTSTDFAVLGEIVAARLRLAAAAAGLDSLAIEVGAWPAGAQVLPVIDVASPVAQAGRALDLVLDQCAALEVRPISADEDARARLRQLGPLVTILGDAEQARDFLVACGRFGSVPADPLAELCSPRPQLLAERAPQLFAVRSAAWTVVADTTRTGGIVTGGERD